MEGGLLLVGFAGGEAEALDFVLAACDVDVGGDGAAEGWGVEPGGQEGDDRCNTPCNTGKSVA